MGDFSSHIIDLIEKALELDPDYAEAYALAGGYFLMTGSFAGNKEMHSAALNAMPYLMDAIELDPEISSAHLNLGTYYLWYNWDYIRAEEEYLKAMDLEPNNLVNISFYLEFLNKMNRPEEVLKFQNIPANNYSDVAKTQVLLGNNEKAENMIQMYIDSLGGDGSPWIGECYLWMGEYDSALKYLEPIRESADMNKPRFKACLALSYYYTNQHNKADAVITQLVESSDTSSAGSPNFYAGWYYSGIGQLDSAFYFLEKAYANRSPEFPWLKADPIFKNLKTDPHYRDLYERTGHKDYDDYMAKKKE
jgi:tetratricopeptide (TPR) repeat protein